MLAGIGIKQYSDAIEAAEYLIKVSEILEPDVQRHCIYMDYYAVYRSLYPSLKDNFAALSRLQN
jgi:xylulokinase